MMKAGYIPVFLFFMAISCKNKVVTVRPVEEKITESVYASGIVKSKDQYQVYASANGVVDNLMVQEGDLVKKGEVLMRLKNSTAQLNTEKSPCNLKSNC
ncbi:MAG: efflux RND transporter periplasmic adaptor subunit [Bacteroidota bacterium]|nr:efflux RND transporter periplasmic adaptor subunit [Bacteroidota bacterium]